MKYIDLLSKKERALNKKAIALNTAIVLLVICLIFMAGSLILVNNKQKNLLVSLEKQREIGEKLQDYSDKLEIYRDFEQKVESKQNTISKAVNSKIIWSDILYSIGETIPKNSYLTNFDGNLAELQKYIEGYSQSNIGDKAVSFTIRGYAKHYLDVSKLLIDLKKIPYINNAWAWNISKSHMTNNTTGLAFSIDTFWDTQLIIKEWNIQGREEERRDQEDTIEYLDE